MSSQLKGIGPVIVGCVLFSVLFTSCGTSKILLNVKRPAEINLKGFKKIAIGDITGGEGNHASDISDGITTMLVQSNSFEVLDRQNLKKIMDEHQLSMTGIVNPDSAAELGKVIGSAVLVFGRIQDDKYQEEITRDDPWTDKEGGYHRTIRRTGIYNISVHLTVVDIQTSKILGVKDIPVGLKEQNTADNKDPASIDVETMYAAALKEICNNFLKLVAAYDVQVAAEFETDKELPEVESALAQFKIGETGEAIKILEGASNKNLTEQKIKAKAIYNLGLAQMYTGRYDDASANFKKAYSINVCTRYQNAIQQCKDEKAQAEKLNAQK